jgi:DNA helicase HerA-like ATPase
VLDIHDLENAPDNVKRAQYANVLGYAWDLARRNRHERVILVVDEAWMLVDPQVPEALGFLRKLSKRIRKYMGSLMVVTQNPIDFLAPEVAREGEPVLANASMKLLLRQEAKDLPTVASLFNLSEAEQERLATARVGEGLLIAGNHRTWVTVDTAPHEAVLMYGKAG